MRDWRMISVMGLRLMDVVYEDPIQCFSVHIFSTPRRGRGKRRTPLRLLSFSGRNCQRRFNASLISRRGGTASMAQQHPPRFLKIVNDAKQRVRETNVDEVKARLDRGEKFALVNVREARKYAAANLPVPAL